jgi:hypothetical protein
MKVQVYSKFRKNKVWKKIKSPKSMRDGRFNTSKCRGKLQKMGVLCTHPPKQPRPLQHARAFKKFFKKKFPNLKNLKNATPYLQRRRLAAEGQLLVTRLLGDRWPASGRPIRGDQRLATAGRGAVGGLRPAVADHSCAGPPLSNPLAPSFLPLCLQIFPHWLQHMPALPKLLLKTSSTHNFWSVGLKNTIFFTRSLREDTSSQKVF